LHVACCILHISCCMLYLAHCMLHVPGCTLQVACPRLHVACRMLHVVCRMLHVVCRMAHLLAGGAQAVVHVAELRLELRRPARVHQSATAGRAHTCTVARTACAPHRTAPLLHVNAEPRCVRVSCMLHVACCMPHLHAQLLCLVRIGGRAPRCLACVLQDQPTCDAHAKRRMHRATHSTHTHTCNLRRTARLTVGLTAKCVAPWRVQHKPFTMQDATKSSTVRYAACGALYVVA
jgi:hypothetical protein